MSFGGIGRLLWSVVAGPKTFRPRQRIPPAAKIIRLPFKRGIAAAGAAASRLSFGGAVAALWLSSIQSPCSHDFGGVGKYVCSQSPGDEVCWNLPRAPGRVRALREGGGADANRV